LAQSWSRTTSLSAVLAGFLLLWGGVSVVLGRRQSEASAKPGRIGL
jgi:hypothetical protein